MPDPRLANVPALRKLAEEEARHIWSVNQRLFRQAGWDVIADPNDPGAVDGFEITVAAQIEIIADLTRPASRDAVCRLVAERAKIRLWAVHLLLLGGTEYPPEWPPSLTDALAGAAEAEALTLIALHVLGSPDAPR